MFEVSDAWRNTYAGAAAGVLVMAGVTNPERSPALDERREALERELRARWAGQDRKALEALPFMQAYRDYYGRFRKSYHVLAQVESVALKGRSLARNAALLQAMFMAEVKNGLLTAGHDVAALALPVAADIAEGSESYETLGGKEQVLAAGDMYMRDGKGIISSIMYGPDRRTPITAGTQRALFAVYAPPGVGADLVRTHLGDIRDHVRLVSPEAAVEMCEVFEAGLGH